MFAVEIVATRQEVTVDAVVSCLLQDFEALLVFLKLAFILQYYALRVLRGWNTNCTSTYCSLCSEFLGICSEFLRNS